MSRSRVRLLPGLRVTDRADGSVQVGYHPACRVVVEDAAATRHLLTLLRHPTDPARLPPAGQDLVARLTAAGLLEPEHDAATRTLTRASATVAVVAPEPAAAVVRRLLVEAELAEAHTTDAPSLTLLVTAGAEPHRAELDRLAGEDQPHLLVTDVAGRVRVGPCVVPGLTACVRCVDEHRVDRDPAYFRLLAGHHQVERTDRSRPGDLGLGLAWAVRDVAALLDGERPTTWSATVDLGSAGPVTQEWRRHPRCGCAWGDLQAG